MTKLSAVFLCLVSVIVFPLLGFSQNEPVPQPKPRPSAPASRPSAKAAPPGGPTLLITCDLACVLKIDGEKKGEIEADGSLKVRVVLGQHIVTAVTTDGRDKVRQEVKIEKTEQTLLELNLSSARTTRLQQEQGAQDEATRAQKLREEQERLADEQRRARAEQVKIYQEAAVYGWVDPATGLVWTKSDNGDGNDLTWQQAMDYCRNLQLGGHRDWRLPTIDELKGIDDANINVPDSNGKLTGMHVKANLVLSGQQWSSSQEYGSGKVWDFKGEGGERDSIPLSSSNLLRAVCVRRSGE